MAATVYILDQTDWSDGVVTRMRARGLFALRVQNQYDFERLLRRRPPDEAIVVESLPNVDAFRMLDWLRDQTDALIGVVPDGDDERSLELFDAGADDVVKREGDPGVIVARVRSLLRRTGGLTAESGPRITIGEVTIDAISRSTCVGQRDVHLTPLEFSILHTLMRDPGVVYSREDLLDFVWGSRDLAVERTIDAHIWKLRRKIESHGGQPRHIVSVPRLGYRFRRPDESRLYERAVAV
jgi:DNA-binding response OmpR family regulator